MVAVILGSWPAVAAAETRLVAAKNVRAAQRFAATRDGSPSFAVHERGTTRGYHATVGYPAASVSKAMILVAKLRQARDRPLTETEREDLGPMITESSNKAARRAFATVGPDGLRAVAAAAKMRRFAIQLSFFEARIDASDQARFFARIDRLMPRRHRAYGMGLLRRVIARQRWGIPDVAGEFDVAFKGGWRKGIVHQVARLELGGRHVAVAVMTRGPTRSYGVDTIAGITRRLLRGRTRARWRPAPASSRRRW